MTAPRPFTLARETLYANRPPVPGAEPMAHLVNVTEQYVPVEEAERLLAEIKRLREALEILADLGSETAQEALGWE